jgi:hypothetical protein
MTQTAVRGSWRKVTFDGRKLWLARNAEEFGHSALAPVDHVDEATERLDPSRCFKSDAFAHAFFNTGAIMRYGTRIGSTADIIDGWPAEEEA